MSRQPVIYLRKSYTRNQDDDLDVHRRRILKVMSERGETGEIIIQEPIGHRSAYYSERRTGYQELLVLLRARRISTLYVNDRSRLWRNDLEWIGFLYLCKEFGTEVVAVTETPIGDVSDSNERLIEFMQGNRAQAYRDDLSKRHKDLKADLKAAGIFAGARAFGLNLIGSKFTRALEPNDDFPTVIELLQLYVSGLGTPSIARELEKRGRTWKDGTRRVKPDPTIILNLIHHLERYQPFLPSDLYRQALITRGLRSNNRSNSRRLKHDPLLLRLLLTCETCGRRFYCQADYKVQGQQIGAYFHPTNLCSNPVKWHRADMIHQQFWTFFDWLDDDTELEKRVTLLCAVPESNEIDYSHTKQKLETQLNNLEDAYLAGDFGELNVARAHYRKKKAELQSKLSALPELPKQETALKPYIVRQLLLNLRATLKQNLDPKSLNLTLQQLIERVPLQGKIVSAPVWRDAESP